MKKVLLAMILFVVALVPTFAAVTDTMLNIGVQNSLSEMTISTEPKTEFKINIDLAGDFAMIFDGGPGFDIALTTESNFGTLELGLYYAHLIEMRNSDVDIILSVGPRFTLTGDFAIAVDGKANFLFNITNDFYLNVGTGLLIDIVSFPGGKENVNILFTIPLPSLAIGFRF